MGKADLISTNHIRLLGLTETAQEALIKEKISSGHARALLGLKSSHEINQILNTIIKKGLTVRQTESLIKLTQDGVKTKEKQVSKSYEISDYLSSISEDLKTILGTKVEIRGKSEKGKIEIDYYSEEELERLIGILKSNG